ncbi:DUF4030 domain-containing protein [Bacillus sp. ISL-77]|uniref:DUF4030 domain-containing protein n=1 Tax=Bacillus sp. ISL-77 TaxID=2819138 RepID=UPI001BE50CCF|nr:DUF4030 domain-containing protein [Bacillus sp. ISL-77]MBT2744756.1 DUF4030 domain-containing protein [Bacillus sp. ISL-77]
MDNNIKKELNQIEIPQELRERVLLGMEQARTELEPNRDKKSWSIGKKITLFSGVAVLFCGLFIGSAFVSPTMEALASKIPYLNLIFHSKWVGDEILEELKRKGYKVSSTGVGYTPKKTVSVFLDMKDREFKKAKPDVEKIVRDILKSRGYDAYSIDVTKSIPREDYIPSGEEKKEMTILNSEVTNRLKQLNFQFNNVQTDPTEHTIFINIGASKDYYNSVKEDVEKAALETVSANHYKGYKINVTNVTVTVRKSDKGSQITIPLSEGLMSKKEFKVTEVGYKIKPLTFIIQTSVQSTDPKSKELGKKLDQMIVEFLNSKEISSILKNESYEIIIKSKDNKKIN